MADAVVLTNSGIALDLDKRGTRGFRLSKLVKTRLVHKKHVY